jgi:hypothetical protein
VTAIDLFNAGRYEEALPLFVPNTPQSSLAIAACLEYTGRYVESIDHFQEAFRRWPCDVTAVQFIASLYKAGYKDAIDQYLPQILRDFDSDTIRYCASEHYLKSGDYAKGFGLFHTRRHLVKDTFKFAALRCEEWDGGPCELLCITAEQGAGDIFQQSAALHYVQGMNVILFVEPRLVRMLQESFPYIRVTGDPREIKIAATSATARKAMLGDIQARYIKAGADWNRRSWIKSPPHAFRGDGRVTVGIAWSSPRGMAGNWKGMPLENFGPILNDQDFRCINLQHGDARKTDLLEDTGIDPTDIDALSATIAACDVVVTTSNTVAHLAGAMGVQTELIIPHSRTVYWYWGYDGGNPIYKSMTTWRLEAGCTMENVRDAVVDAYAAI